MFRKSLLIQGILACSTLVYAGAPAGTSITVSVDTPRNYSGTFDPSNPILAWSYELTHAGASYIAVHFADFDLAPGDSLLLTDPSGKQAYTLQGHGKMGAGTFWAQHIKGDVVILQMIVTGTTGGKGFIIDRYAAGYPDIANPPTGPVATADNKGLTKPPDRGNAAICGQDDKKNAICYESQYAAEYRQSRAIARMLINGTTWCSGWLISDQNHLVTNQHCIASQSDATNTDYEFMSEAPSCIEINCSGCFPGQIFSGAEFIQASANLDYSLVRITTGTPAATYGYMEIEDRPAEVGEQIYIPQYPNGRAKEIAITSTDSHDTNGLCRIYSLNEPACSEGVSYYDLGYFADTEAGSSGSPVVLSSTNRVIGLHHCANCPNRAVPMYLICNEMPEGMCGSSAGAVLLDRNAYRCDDRVAIRLSDRDLKGAETANVTMTSDVGDSEIVTLHEQPAKSGIFVSAIATGSGGPINNDTILQVADGNQITVTYYDADNGQGQSVNTIDTAIIDCIPPTLCNVTVAGVTSSSAAVTFQTDEYTLSTVSFGPSCAARPFTASSAQVGTQHCVTLDNLIQETSYFFAVSCQDAAGNVTINDQGGQCFSLRTPTPATDFFTELFSGSRENDLDNLSILFIPDGSPNYYRACTTPISSLPTDPAGGTMLTLDDDDFEVVDYHVSLYGRCYTQFFVASNGFITLREGDKSYGESLQEHFRLPRISALFDDLNPPAGGTITWKLISGGVAVTWAGVPEYDRTATNTFQVEMFDNGRIRISYLGIAALDGLAGLSAGNGMPSNFISSDLSGYATCLRPLEIVNALSRMPHGPPNNTISMDINLLDPSGSCEVVTECRSGGPIQIIITFDLPILLRTGTPEDVRISNGNVSTLTVEDRNLFIGINGTQDGQRLRMTFPGVISTEGEPTASTMNMGILAGDINHDCLVNVEDLLAIRNQINKSLEPMNAACDINLDGRINVVDLLEVRNVINHKLAVADGCP